MHKRSEPSTREPFNYEPNPSLKNPKNLQTEDQMDNSIDRFINDVEFIRVLNKRGIKKLFPIQMHSFKPIYEGYDIIARDRTGSGKTLAFTLPVIERLRQKKFEHKYPKFLIILPTRQLAIQVHNEIQSLKYLKDDYKSLVVYGKSSIESNIYKLKQGVDILVGTPGRLNDLIERGQIRLESLEVLCLDQADQILKQGFKEEVDKIFRKLTLVNKNKIQYLMFSATVPDWLKKLSEQFQSSNVAYINLIKDEQISTSRTITHLAVEVNQLNEDDMSKLIEQIVQKYGGYDKRILIFCDKKIEVDNLSRSLRLYNQTLHGDIAQKRREMVYQNYKNGSLKCIIATNVAARGLDFPSVDLVIQMTPPMKTEDYIHRAGRTGRAGKEGTCLTFFDRTKKRNIYRIQDEAKIKIQQVKVEFNQNQRSRRQDNNGYNNNNNRDRQNNRFEERNNNNNRNYDSERRNHRFENNRDQGQGQQRRNYGNSGRDQGKFERNNENRGNNYRNRDQQRSSTAYKNEQKPSYSSSNNARNHSPNSSRSRSASPKHQSKSYSRSENKEDVSSHYKSSSPKRQEKRQVKAQNNEDLDY